MSCSNRNARLLSECLDGRLPSRRREALLEHIDACASCRRTYEELQNAQDLILRTPRESVGANFRDGLWQRIRAGEGTPEHALRSPIPWASKIRYVATGAAAAAVVIASLQVAAWISEPDRAPNGGIGDDVAMVDDSANGVDERGAGRDSGLHDSGRLRGDPGRLRARAPGTGLFAEMDRTDRATAESEIVFQLDGRGFDGHAQFWSGPGQLAGDVGMRAVEPLTLAQTVNEELRSNTRRLVWRARHLSEDRNNVDGADLREVQSRALEAAANACTLRWLAEEDLVQLPHDTEQVVSQLIGLGKIAAEDGDNLDRLVSIVFEAARLDTDSLDAKFSLRCCPDPATFRFKLFEHVRQNPNVARVLRLQVVPRGGVAEPGTAIEQVEVFQLRIGR